MSHDCHHDQRSPSAWIQRFLPLVPPGARVLDLACGGGRNTALFLKQDCQVVAVDRDISGLAHLSHWPTLEALEIDLEAGRGFPPSGAHFDVVMVVNYLYRPLLPRLIATVAAGGLLLYETFARGNEAFGRPRNPDFLLQPGELLEAVRGRLRVIAYEDMIVDDPAPAAVQRICARNEIQTAVP